MYTNAGLTPTPVIVRAARGALEWLSEPANLLVGVEPDTAYVEGRVTLEPGDKLVVCTDGITDSINAHEDRFTWERLSALLAENTALPAEALRDRIIGAVTGHTGAAAQYDDQTLLIMEVLR